MVRTASVSSQIDARLKEIAAEVEFLPELAALWAEESATNRDVWYLEWRELMARLQELDRAYRGGVMDERQREQYQALRRTLQEHLPLFRRLDLPLPSVPLED